MIGTLLTHYRITAKLGDGGMGEVFRARDTLLHRDVAVKVLPKAKRTCIIPYRGCYGRA